MLYCVYLFVFARALLSRVNGRTRERDEETGNPGFYTYSYTIDFLDYFTYPVYSTDTRGTKPGQSLYPDTDEPVVMLIHLTLSAKEGKP